MQSRWADVYFSTKWHFDPFLIHPAGWPQETWVKNWVGAVPFFSGKELCPHRIQSRLATPTSMPSGILVH